MSATKKIRKNKYKRQPRSKQRTGRIGGFLGRMIKLPFSIHPVPVLTGAGILIALAGITYALILTYSLVVQSSVFGATTLHVTGTSRLSETDVLKQADIYTGRNIFDINLMVTRKRLLAHPWIKKAEVIREMPDTIRIKVVEHVPIAVVDFGKHYLINRDGDIFKHFEGETDTLPVVSGVLPRDFNIAGKQIIRTQTLPLKSLLSLLSILKRTEAGILKEGVKQIVVDRDVGMTLIVERTVNQVKLGYGNYDEKLKRLNEVMGIIGKKATLVVIDTIDLNNINRIVVKPVTLEAQV